MDDKKRLIYDAVSAELETDEELVYVDHQPVSGVVFGVIVMTIGILWDLIALFVTISMMLDGSFSVNEGLLGGGMLILIGAKSSTATFYWKK